MAATSELDVVVSGRDNLSPELQKLESKVIRFVGAISAALAGIKIGAAPIIAAANFERELANVAKTTNFTTGQINQLSDALLKISTQTNVSAVDLAKIAAAAGQQGLGKQGVKGVVQFTDSVARMASVLDLTAEDAAVNVGKIINIFKLPLSEIERATSIFNEISNNSTANGKDLLNVVKRIGDAAGALNLQQSSALAATGLDFGLSPEVVGTAIARVYSAAFEKADEFGKLMKTSAIDWVKVLKTDGIAGFKQFLDTLRGLDEQSQQKAIVKLVGGGRIGSLLNKLVQDTSNAVLDKNLANASKGSLGTSALQEQAKVLNTLTAQAQILQNTFVKLGIDAAKSLLGPLTQYTAQLSQTLETPGVKSFVNAAVQALGQLITVVVNAAKFVADLNINWENFLKVVKVFVGLKVAESFLGLASRLTGLSSSLKSVSKEATSAAAATAALNKAGAAGDNTQAFKASTLSRKLGYEELSVAWQKRKAELAEEAAAEQKVLSAARKSEAARAATVAPVKAASGANAAANLAGTKVGNARSDVLFQESAVIAAQNKQNDAYLANQARFEDRQVRAKQFTANKLLQIETDYQARVASALAASKAAEVAQAQASARLTAAQNAPANRSGAGALLQADKATQIARLEQELAYQTQRRAQIQLGVETELAAATTERTEKLANQAKYQDIALANQRAFLVKRLAQIEAAGGAEVAAEKATLAARITALDQLKAAQTAANANAAGTGATAAAASAAAQRAAVELEAAKAATALSGTASASAGIFARISAGATAAFSAIGVGLRTLAGVAVAAGRIIASGFLWLTVVYSILDLTGVLEKVGPFIQRVTDFLGFSSKAQRDHKVAVDAASEALRKQAEELDTLTVAYNRNLDAISKKVDTQKIDALVQQISLGSPEARQTALTELAQFFDGAEKLAVAYANSSTEAINKGVKNQKDAIVAANAEITKLRQEQAQQPTFGASEFDGATAPKDFTEAIAKQQAIVAAATAQLNAYATGLGAVGANAANASTNATAAFDRIAGLFTPQSVKAIEDYAIPLALAKEEAAKIQEEFKNVGKNALAAGKDVENATAGMLAALQGANKKVDDLGKSFSSFLSSNEADNSFLLLPALAQQGSSALAALAANAKKAGAAVNGTVKIAPVPKAAGTGSFTGKNTESAARKLEKANLELARANIQAENHLADERSKQLLAKEDDFYKHGLKSLESYYSNREDIQLAAVARDIADKQLEIKAAEQEAAAVAKTDPAAAVQTHAKIAQLRGQIAVLNESKKGIIDENTKAIRDGNKEFSDLILQQTNRLVEDGIITTDTATAFKSNLEELESSYKDMIARLRVEGKGALADSIIAGFNVQAFQKSITAPLQAVDLAFAELNRTEARIALAQQTSGLSSAEANFKTTEAIKGQLPLLQEQLGYMQDQLRVLGETAGVGSLAYEKMAASIDDVTLRLQTLAAQQNKTAQDVNKSLGDSLTGALDKLQPTFKSLKETVLGLLLDIANNMKHLFAEQLSQEILKGIGSVGDGGLGKIVQDLLQKTFAASATQSSGLGINAAGSGFSAAKDTGLVNAGAQAVTTTAADATSAAASSAALSAIVAPAGEAAVALAAVGVPAGEASLGLAAIGLPAGETAIAMSALVAPAAELLIAFSAIVGPAASAAAALAAVAAASSSQATASVITTAAAAAHTGGVVGQNATFRRRVDPAVFNNAIRYHTGSNGPVGLKRNEIPTILEKGEHVLTARQAAAQKAASRGGSPINIRSVLVTDPNFVPDAMASSQGEKTLLTVLSRNKSTLKQLVS